MGRTRDGIYRRGQRYAFRYKDLAGKWHEIFTGCDDRAGAIAVREQHMAELEKGTLPDKAISDWRLTEAIAWWNDYREPRLSESNKRSEPYRLQHFPHILGDLKLSQAATNVHLDTYQTARMKAGIGPDTINREIAIWSQIFRKAKLWHRVADDYRPLKVKPSAIGQALTREQLRHLADVAAGDIAWEASFYGSVLAANSGMRVGEILSLVIGDIHLDTRRITLRHAKTAAGVRTIELNADALEATARLLMRAREHGCILPSHFLMPKNLSRITHGPHKGERGYDPLQHQVDWGTAWASLTEAAGFPTLRFHDLRHSFITALVERGVHLGTIQVFVGHISTRMLLHYTHISSGVARKAVEMLDAEPMLEPTLTAAQEPHAAQPDHKDVIQ